MSDEIDINLILHKLHKYQKKLENAEHNGRENLDIYKQKIQFYYEQLGGLRCTKLWWSSYDKLTLNSQIQSLIDIIIRKQSEKLKHIKVPILTNYTESGFDPLGQLNPPNYIIRYKLSTILLETLRDRVTDYKMKCFYFDKFKTYNSELWSELPPQKGPVEKEIYGNLNMFLALLILYIAKHTKCDTGHKTVFTRNQQIAFGSLGNRIKDKCIFTESFFILEDIFGKNSELHNLNKNDLLNYLLNLICIKMKIPIPEQYSSTSPTRNVDYNKASDIAKGLTDLSEIIPGNLSDEDRLRLYALAEMGLPDFFSRGPTRSASIKSSGSFNLNDVDPAAKRAINRIINRGNNN